MVKFPIAIEKKEFKIEGLEGRWIRSSYADAKANPEAVRAMRGKVLSWFVPVNDLLSEIVNGAAEEAELDLNELVTEK